jgi:hypothetical protein
MLAALERSQRQFAGALSSEFLWFVKAHYRLRDHVRAVKP